MAANEMKMTFGHLLVEDKDRRVERRRRGLCEMMNWLEEFS